MPFPVEMLRFFEKALTVPHRSTAASESHPSAAPSPAQAPATPAQLSPGVQLAAEDMPDLVGNGQQAVAEGG
jgi:hypothetical protein